MAMHPTRLLALWEYLRGTYWAVPSAMSAGAVALSIGMTQLDQAAPATLDRLAWVYAGGPEGARAVLSTIAASMITVAGVTFSITIVALTLASQQFGPRLLRNFLRDLGNQIVLGTFIATFLYCLLVLRTVRGSDDEEFVPQLAVTAGVLLAMVSLGVLIYFIHHVATSIQASRIIANVAEDLGNAITRLFPEAIGEDQRAAAPPVGSNDPAGNGQPERTVRAATTGYVQAIDAERLMDAAREQEAVARVHARPGAFVTKGAALLTLRSRRPRGSDGGDETIRRAFMIGSSRTGTQDVTFFIDQLVELAVRALSPGTNDPGTARLCIDRLEEALRELAGRQMPSAERYDDKGHLRVVAAPLTFAEATQCAFDEIAHYGRSSVLVTCRLLNALASIGSCVQRERDRHALRRQADSIAAGTEAAATLSAGDHERITRAYRATIAALRTAGDA